MTLPFLASDSKPLPAQSDKGVWSFIWGCIKTSCGQCCHWALTKWIYVHTYVTYDMCAHIYMYDSECGRHTCYFERFQKDWCYIFGARILRLSLQCQICCVQTKIQSPIVSYQNNGLLVFQYSAIASPDVCADLFLTGHSCDVVSALAFVWPSKIQVGCRMSIEQSTPESLY